MSRLQCSDEAEWRLMRTEQSVGVWGHQHVWVPFMASRTCLLWAHALWSGLSQVPHFHEICSACSIDSLKSLFSDRLKD